MADEIRALDPTIRERLSSGLQQGMEGLGMDRYKARQRAQTVMGGESSNLPMGMGIADFVPFIGTTMGAEEGAHDLGKAYDAAKRGDYIDAAANTVGAAAGLIPGATTATIPQAGHAPQLEQPRAFAQMALDFLG